MDDIKNDPRFAHIATDPRFRPMPKSKRKVKIDSRFQSLFTNKHFSHKTDIDKRGRPVLDWTKKSKHVMERFYELSDSDLESDNKSDTDLNDLENEGQQIEQQMNQAPNTNISSKILEGKKVTKKSSKSTEDKVQESTIKETLLKKKRKWDSIGTHTETSFKQKRANQQKFNDKDSEDEDNSSEGEEMKETDRNENVARGPGDEEENHEEDDSKDEYSDSEDDDTELPEFTKDYALEETNIEHKWNELHTDAPAVTESTRRLAVCNMDWDFVKAQDLYVLFKSFVPDGGRVKSVSIYPSEFGKERMAEEALLGPREIRNGVKMDGDSEDEEEKKKKRIKDQKKMKQYEKERKAAQTEKLREYQLNRLRYYYAVVDCDSARTADAIYSECDGREYQLSSVRLDLRYIPDDMTFDDEPKASFSEEQSIVGYQPSKFSSTALSQGKVDVTWDETEFDRLTRHISALPSKELESIVEENKYAEIIAPPESDSEDSEDERPDWLKAALSENNDEHEKELTEEEKIQLYRQVLMDALAEDEEEKKKEEGEMDKEIEWQPGLKEKVQKNIQKKEKLVDSTIVSGFLEKKREKKKKKREDRMSKKATSPEEDKEAAFSDDEIPEGAGDESLKELMEGEKVSAKGKKNKKKKQKKDVDVLDEAGERAKAELELILMDEGASEKKLSKPELVSESKKKKKKKAKLLKQKKTEAEQVDFKLDVEDPRFSALYTSHLFHIDPTAPQFKKTKNMMKLVDEQIKRKKPKNKSKPDPEAKQQTVNTGNKTFSEVLVESLKRKMKK